MTNIKGNKIIKNILLVMSIILISITTVCSTVGFVKMTKYNRIQNELQLKEQQEIQQAHKILKENFEYVVDTISDNANSSTVLSGTYLIKNEQNLIKLSKLVNVNGINTSTASFIQTADIVITQEIDPIGYIDSTNKDNVIDRYFMGNYDGQNYTITVSTKSLVKQTHAYFIGLFGCVCATEGKTVNINNVNIKYNCDYSNSSTDKTFRIGGIIGYADGEGTLNINNCHTLGEIKLSDKSTRTAGGLIGKTKVSKVEIKDCSSKLYFTDKTKTSKDSYFGGMVGYINDENVSTVNISNCVYFGKMDIKTNSNETYVGGIVGYSYGTNTSANLNIERCSSVAYYNQGENNSIQASGNDVVYVGGMLGSSITKFIIDQCYNLANIYGESSSKTKTVYVGGISGYLSGTSEIKNCYNKGVISSSSTVTESKDNSIDLTTRYEDKRETNTNVGKWYHKRWTWLCVDGKKTDKFTNLIDWDDRGEIKLTSTTYQNTKYSTKYSYLVGYDYAGGICGYDNTSSTTFNITNCYNNGNVYSKQSSNYFKFNQIGAKFIYLYEYVGLLDTRGDLYYDEVFTAEDVMFYGDYRNGEISGNQNVNQNSYTFTTKSRSYSLTGKYMFKSTNNSNSISITSKNNNSYLTKSMSTTFKNKAYKVTISATTLNSFKIQIKIGDENTKDLKSLEVSNIFNSRGMADSSTYSTVGDCPGFTDDTNIWKFDKKSYPSLKNNPENWDDVATLG